MLPDTVGGRLRLLRQLRCLTLAQVATTLGCTPAALSRLECNRLHLSPARLQQLATLFDVSATYILDGLPAHPRDLPARVRAAQQRFVEVMAYSRQVHATLQQGGMVCPS